MDSLSAPRRLCSNWWRISDTRGDTQPPVFENDPQFTEAEKWALRYAFLMYREPKKLNKDFYDEGKKHFSEAQIMELGGMIALHYGMQVFMRTLKAFPMHDPEGNPISQKQSEKTYGSKVGQ